MRGLEVALQAGWNAPAGWGVQAMYRLPEQRLAFGAAAGLSLWGWKAAAVARWMPAADLPGLFVQGSFGFTGGREGVPLPVPQLDGGTRNAIFDFSAGRNLDAVAGYRWAGEDTFFEAFLGYSVRLRGVALQDVSQSQVAIDEATRGALDMLAPGGIAWSLAYGWYL